MLQEQIRLTNHQGCEARLQDRNKNESWLGTVTGRFARPRVSRFARGLLRNIVEPLFRGRPSGPWQVSPKINGGLAGIC